MVGTSSESRSLAEALAPDSAAVRPALQNLECIYSESESLGPVNNSYRFWVASRPFLAGTSPKSFINDTCLSMLSRLIAYRFLESRPSERDLWAVMSGDYFVGAGLSNFLGEDFFSWPFFRLSMGIGDDAISLETARLLLLALEPLRVDQLDDALLSDLHFEFQGTDAAERTTLASDVFAEDPALSCIAPYCGDGSALSQAVRAALGARVASGQFPSDALLDISGQFLGMTSEPLAATIASVRFLLALGEEVTEPHPPILVPVYMAHGAHLPPERRNDTGAATFAIEPAGGVALPDRVAADPLYLDWLLGRLPNYLRGTALRLRAQPEDVAVQEVLNAWYNYLVSPKARTPIPDALSPEDADTMVEAARNIILQYVGGSGSGPLHIVRNAPAPLFASRREFSMMLWPAELDSDHDLREACSALYLKGGGQVLNTQA